MSKCKSMTPEAQATLDWRQVMRCDACCVDDAPYKHAGVYEDESGESMIIFRFLGCHREYIPNLDQWGVPCANGEGEA